MADSNAPPAHKPSVMEKIEYPISNTEYPTDEGKTKEEDSILSIMQV